MKPTHSIVISLVISACAIASLNGCGKSGSNTGSAGRGSGAGNTSKSASGGTGGGEISGTYTSLEDADLSMQFKSGGIVVFTAKDVGSSQGTYSVDGEKIIVNVKGQQSIFIRDGDCIKDNLDVYGKLCKGGKAGAAGNVSTHNMPATPSGTYIATNEDGTFKVEFKTGNKLTFTATPASGVPGKPEVHEGAFVIEGDQLHVKLDDSTPLVLQFVNNNYESTSFGLPMKFVKQ